MTNEIYTSIEQQFESRMKAHRIGKDSPKYKKAQSEFFTGAMAALVAIIQQPTFIKETTDIGKAMPPKWVFSIMTNDTIIK